MVCTGNPDESSKFVLEIQKDQGNLYWKSRKVIDICTGNPGRSIKFLSDIPIICTGNPDDSSDF